jgi:hypothetical protein
MADVRADADAGPSVIGIVSFSQAVDGGGLFFAGFGEVRPPAPTNCKFFDAGSCATALCPAPPATDGGDASAAGDAGADSGVLGAGTLTVSGGDFGTGFAIDQDMAGTYVYPTPGALFSPGDVLGVSATGGAVQAFAKHTVVATPTMMLTAPMADGGKMTIQTSQPLTVSWTGGRAGATAVLVATAYFTSGGGASMTCTWDGAMTPATVPSEVLEPLATENAVLSGFTWYQIAQAAFDDGPARVTLSAYTSQSSLAAFE